MVRSKDRDVGKLSGEYAVELRDRATKAERQMCVALDAERISYVFQANMYDAESGRIYIADFRIRRLSLARPAGVPRKRWVRDTRKLFIEIDGGYHVGREAYDAARTRWIESHRNAVVLRFTNEEVLASTAHIIEQINKYGPARRSTYCSWSSRATLQQRTRIQRRLKC